MALKRYERFMDRGLIGLRYHMLLSRVAELRGKKSLARRHRERAMAIVAKINECLTQAKHRQAFEDLPGVSGLLAPR